MKSCRKCGMLLELSAFYVHPRMADGHLNICKECTKDRIRRYSTGNPIVLERERARSKQPHRREANAQWAAANRHKVNASKAVHRAVKRGELAPASACECQDCGRPAAVLHHHSYEREHWLDVVPLCKPCHGIRHAHPQRFNA